MKFCLRFYASLGAYLPEAGGSGKTIELELPEKTTPQDVIDRYQVPQRLAHLVLLNGIYLPPPERRKVAINDGDTLSVWPPVAGG